MLNCSPNWLREILFQFSGFLRPSATIHRGRIHKLGGNQSRLPLVSIIAGTCVYTSVRLTTVQRLLRQLNELSGRQSSSRQKGAAAGKNGRRQEQQVRAGVATAAVEEVAGEDGDHKLVMAKLNEFFNSSIAL